MKHEPKAPALVIALQKADIDVTQTQKKQLITYYSLILKWNQKINLVSRVDTQKNLIHHFAASFIYWDSLLGLAENSKIADLGTGGGFPGIVLAIMFPQHRFALIDSSRKKTLFLKTVCRELGLNIEIINARIEEMRLGASDRMDIVVARGLASLSEIVVLAGSILKKPGKVFTLKGLYYVNELNPQALKSRTIKEIEIAPKWKELSPLLNDKIMLKVEY